MSPVIFSWDNGFCKTGESSQNSTYPLNQDRLHAMLLLNLGRQRLGPVFTRHVVDGHIATLFRELETNELAESSVDMLAIAVRLLRQ
jgi:hypothetical protein